MMLRRSYYQLQYIPTQPYIKDSCELNFTGVIPVTQRKADLVPTLKFNACVGQWPKQSAKGLSFSVSVQSSCDRK